MQNAYSYLDLDQFRSLYCLRGEPRKMKFYIEGIRCSKCIAKIEGLKSKNPELSAVEVDLAHHTAVIEIKESKNSFAQVAESISALGFKAVPMQSDDDVSSQWLKESRRDLVRLGVAGYCAGNIMMLAFSTYFGLSGSMKNIFEWVQLFLYMPVVTYVAWPFYRGFVDGIKSKKLSIDGPMAIASFLGFAVSTWNLAHHEGSIYFDSTSGFLFLILATRYFQKRARHEYLRYLKPSTLFEITKARLLRSDYWVWERSDALSVDDIIKVEKGEWVPADGTLMDSEATVDLSILNGESYPNRVMKGFLIKAGSRLLSESARIKVATTGNKTLLGNLLASLKTGSIEDSDSSRVSNKASQILLAVVLSLAAITLVVGALTDFSSQFEKAFALIVLACPCAMAFGTPLAFSFSMKKAQDNGILIKSPRVFENLAETKTVFLDKTGTVTERFWNISESSLDDPPQIYKQIILLLESRSQHPVAFALREVWNEVALNPDFTLTAFEEVPRQGVKGLINGLSFEFRSYEVNGQKWFGLFESSKLVWNFQLKPVLQNGAKGSIEFLKDQGYNVILVSGDSQAETFKTAKQLGIPDSQAFGNLSPAEKLALVEKNSNCIMIGDGVNDTLALQKAKVGIAVKGGVDLALRSADVLFLQEGLTSLIKLIALGDGARKQIRRNLKAALIYNTLGGAAALMGFVNPFVAALLMPASSLFILGTTWWGTKR